MNPQEKAKTLMEKFRGIEMQSSANISTMGTECAKEAAEICVDEIISLLNGDGKSWDINCYWNGEKFISSRDTKDYYQKVKEEIQKI